MSGRRQSTAAIRHSPRSPRRNRPSGRGRPGLQGPGEKSSSGWGSSLRPTSPRDNAAQAIKTAVAPRMPATTKALRQPSSVPTRRRSGPRRPGSQREIRPLRTLGAGSRFDAEAQSGGGDVPRGAIKFPDLPGGIGQVGRHSPATPHCLPRPVPAVRGPQRLFEELERDVERLLALVDP
jgi:hypothetical protein